MLPYFGPNRNQMMNPRTGSARMSTIQMALFMALAELYTIFMMAHTSSTRTISPISPPIFILSGSP